MLATALSPLVSKNIFSNEETIHTISCRTMKNESLSVVSAMGDLKSD
jgi:hypothetical protein